MSCRKGETRFGHWTGLIRPRQTQFWPFTVLTHHGKYQCLAFKTLHALEKDQLCTVKCPGQGKFRTSGVLISPWEKRKTRLGPEPNPMAQFGHWTGLKRPGQTQFWLFRVLTHPWQDSFLAFKTLQAKEKTSCGHITVLKCPGQWHLQPQHTLDRTSGHLITALKHSWQDQLWPFTVLICSG